MTALAHRPHPAARAAVRTVARVRTWSGAHRRSLLWLASTLIAAAVISFVNIGGAPQRIDDEGTYTAQAWAVDNLGTLAHYTFWYDHPPLGWIQIALYARLTGAFARYPIAVLAGREAVVVASLAAVVVLFVLSRRLGLSRSAAAVAGVLFAVSPLALQFHRTVYLDNVATPWLLAAVLLCLSRRGQLAAFTGAALCFGVAVLSKETYLIALPLLVFLAARSAHPETRRYTLSVALSVMILVGGGYLLLAGVKGELLPGAHRVSLLDGVMFQLGGRASSGSPFDGSSLTSRTLGLWWQLDPVLIVAGLAAALAALAVRRLRAFGILLIAASLFVFRPGGYVPVPYVIMLLPFAALLISGVVDAAVGTLRERRRWTPAIATLLVAAGALVTAVPLWGVQLRGFLHADLDAPMRQAESWVGANVPRDRRLIVDDAMWVDLVQQGRDRDDVVWYYKVDTDPAVERRSPDGWRDASYVVTTDSMRTFPDGFPQVQKAIDNSVVVASFGDGVRRVDVRQVQPAGLAAERRVAQARRSEDRASGAALAGNPRLTASRTDVALLADGVVDRRVMIALGAELGEHRVTVSGFRAPQGDAAGVPRRSVAVSAIDGSPAVRDGRPSRTAGDFVALLGGEYHPAHVRVVGDDLVLSYPLPNLSAPEP